MSVVNSPYVSTTSLPEFRLWQEIEARRVPLSFDLELTARCNNDCGHCYNNLPAGDHEARRRELTTAEISDIAGQAVSFGALWCLITGGEPLLREDFAEIYLALKQKGLLVSVFTNACLLNEEHVALFSKYPPRDVEVTAYGVTEETYERVTRRRGSYAAFRRGLHTLLDGGVRVRLKAMALRSNVHELPEIAAFCREHTKDYFRFDPFLHLRADGNRQRNEAIIAERLSPSEIVAIEQSDEERSNFLRRECNELITPELAHTDCNHLFHCGAGKESFFVSYDGKFRLCSSLCHPECTYDLRSGTLEDAWKNFVPKARDMRSFRREFLDTCHRCLIVNLCSWCPAHAHLETGELDGSVGYFCEVAHARAQMLVGTQNQK
jgi:radical SAM protein with 4Fe4S-binding SPASM domain